MYCQEHQKTIRESLAEYGIDLEEIIKKNYNPAQVASRRRIPARVWIKIIKALIKIRIKFKEYNLDTDDIF